MLFTAFVLTKDLAISNRAPSATSDLSTREALAVSRIIIAKAHRRASVHRLSRAISMIGEGEVRRSVRPSLLPILARRIPNLFAASHNIVNCKISGKTTNNVSLHKLDNNGTHLVILVSKRPRCTNVFKRPVTSTCRALLTSQIRMLHNPTSMLCNSGTVNNMMGVIAHGVRRSKVHARLRAKCNSCGALRARLAGHVHGKHFSDIVDNSCGHASKRHTSVKFRRCNNCNQVNCRIASR